MNSVILTENGKYTCGQIPKPEPGPNQVLIKVDSAALNPSDILFMRGLYNIKLNYPYTPGWEGSGTVVEVGPGLLAEFFKGKRVAFNKQMELGAFKYGGAMADYCVTDIRGVIPLNEKITFEQGASLFVNPLTALAMVDRLKELKCRTVLVTAAAS